LFSQRRRCVTVSTNQQTGPFKDPVSRQTKGQFTVTSGQGLLARIGLVISIYVFIAGSALAAPYASLVMDARSGEVLSARNADTRLHPASLTKMMTLYIAFEALQNGEITLDTQVRISRHAASEPPSKLGLREGQRIAFRYLIRAAAIKSANDAATAIGEAIEGSEAAFARRMNRTAKALGMTRTTFRNAHGLTEEGHLSTARDMTILGRHLFFDYPQYYNIFSRQQTDAGVAEVANTNRRFLSSYRGADGIKTGYTRAAGFNLTATAERGNKRIIATIFGGNSTATRNAHMAELLDRGFGQAPERVAVRAPVRPPYMGRIGGTAEPAASVALAVAQSLRPVPRPIPGVSSPSDDVLIAVQAGISETLAALDLDAPASPASTVDVRAVEEVVAVLSEGSAVETPAVEVSVAAVAVPDVAPRARPETLVDAAMAAAAPVEEAPREVVARMSTSGGRHWGINIGRYSTRHQAERTLLQTALMELSILDGALRKVVQTPRGFDANFVGMSEEEAVRACRRLSARSLSCQPLGPS
jgi:D-alanyl-D-alanine carboxypeptidase